MRWVGNGDGDGRKLHTLWTMHFWQKCRGVRLQCARAKKGQDELLERRNPNEPRVNNIRFDFGFLFPREIIRGRARSLRAKNAPSCRRRVAYIVLRELSRSRPTRYNDIRPRTATRVIALSIIEERACVQQRHTGKMSNTIVTIAQLFTIGAHGVPRQRKRYEWH